MKPPTSRHVTLKDVASRAGVALSSVSRVLNDRPGVSASMRQRVLAAIDELGYQRNLIAEGLRRGFTNIIGCIVRDISHPMFADIVKGLESELHAQGFAAMVSNSDGVPAKESEHVRMLRQHRVTGLVLSLTSETYEPTLHELRQFEGPLVLIDRTVDALSTSAVLCDNTSGVTQAISHMLSVGHERIGYIGGPEDILAARERLRGYTDAHRTFGVPVSSSLVKSGSLGHDYGYSQTKTLLQMDPRHAPTAIFASGLRLAVGSLLALAEEGISVGEMMSFASFDDAELLEIFSPPINVVTRDRLQIGAQAAGLIIKGLREPGNRHTVRLDTRYVIRGSVRKPSAGAPRT
jgi:LacI family transcriptional regulator